MTLTLQQMQAMGNTNGSTPSGTLTLSQIMGQQAPKPNPLTTSPTGHVRPAGITNMDVANYAQTKSPMPPNAPTKIGTAIDTLTGIPDAATQSVVEMIKPFLRTGVSMVNLGAAIGTALKGGNAQQINAEASSPRKVGGVFGTLEPVGGTKFLSTGKGFGGAALDAASTGMQIGASLPLGGEAGIEAKSGLNMAKDALDARAVRNSFQDALDITKPVLSKSEEVAATASGRKTAGGLLGKVDVAPVARDIERASVASEAGVKKSLGATGNIAKLQDFIDSSVSKVREGLKASNAIWNKNELKGVLNDVQLPITVKSETNLTRQANLLKQGIVKIAEAADKKTVGILDTRQAADKLINKEFPNLYDGNSKPMQTYIRALRQSLNDFVESKIPDGKLPDGSSFKGELRKQNLAIEAKGNIAEKAPRMGTTRLQNFSKNNPVKSALIKNTGKGLAYGLGIGGGAAGVYEGAKKLLGQ